ncbi:MAG: hypothetical protein F9K23_06005 [Bacteroidetes bacterium]|nr:MAG: hypothetical protein F9K23_06005 [Bacteroidota bacterium]
MFEILKFYTDEPHKFTKLIYEVLKVLLSLALMFVLYDWVLGRKIAEDLTNITQWVLLFREGFVLVMIFLFFISYVFLFEIIDFIRFWGQELLLLILRQFGLKNPVVLSNSIATTLVIAKVIHRPDPTQRGVAGKNFDEFYDFFYSIMEEEENGRLPSAKQLLQLLIAFAIIYPMYALTTYNISIGWLSLIIIGIIIVFGILIKSVIQAIKNNKTQIEDTLNWLGTEKILLHLMQRMGFEEIKPNKIIENTNSTDNLYTKFKYEGIEYIVYIQCSDSSIKRPQVIAAIEVSKIMRDCHLIYVVSNELSEKAKEVWNSYSIAEKTLIQFENGEDLIEKFIAEFE